MRNVTAKGNYLLLHDDGTIHYPFSKFLTHEFDNASTRDSVRQSLGIYCRFCTAHEIDLVVRGIEGRCHTYDECKKLIGLCYRSLGEIKSLSNKKVRLITSAKAGKPPKDLSGAVDPNTVLKRLLNIASYLEFYRDVFLAPNIQSSELLNQLRHEYDKTIHQLQNAIKGTKEGNPHAIKSLPSAKFLQIIRVIFVRAEQLFRTDSGKRSRTLKRDRAMALLACEGLRPGAIGNITRSDFRACSRRLVIKDNRNRRAKTVSSTPVLKLGVSTQVNSASETMIELWPFTVDAILDYIETERTAVLSKRLKNHSNGFLFLNDKGEPIKHRSSITTMFNSLGKRLSKLGLLDVGEDPYFMDQKKYDFYAYVFRHSSANFYLEQKGTSDTVLDEMKIRYGWTRNSKQPQRYAIRILSDRANINLMEFYQSIIAEVKANKTINMD